MSTRTLLAPLGDAAACPKPVDVGALFAAHAPFLVRVMERLTGSPALAEDIVQDAFIVAHRRRHELRDLPEVRGWLYRVCTNKLREHRRSIWRHLRLLGGVATEPPLTPVAVPDDVTQRLARARRIRACVLDLPLLQREALVLFELEGESTRSVASLLGVPEGTVASRLAAARASFREHWLAAEGA